MLRLRWGDQQFFRGAFIARQLASGVPDFQHVRVFEWMSGVELNPMLKRQALSGGTGVILQTHTPMRGLSKDLFVYLARGSEFH
jgi:hypothetical protein